MQNFLNMAYKNNNDIEDILKNDNYTNEKKHSSFLDENRINQNFIRERTVTKKVKTNSYFKHFQWNSNSCHLDSFLEVMRACLNPSVLSKMDNLGQLRELLTKFNDDDGENSDSEMQGIPINYQLKIMMYFRDLFWSNVCSIPEKISVPKLGQSGDAGDWFRFCGKFSENLVNIQYTRVSQCTKYPSHIVSEKKKFPIIQVEHLSGEDPKTVVSKLNGLLTNYKQRCPSVIGYEKTKSGLQTSVQCDCLANFAVKDLILPEILVIDFTPKNVKREIPLSDIKVKNWVYEIRGVIRYSGGHFMSYVKYGNDSQRDYWREVDDLVENTPVYGDLLEKEMKYDDFLFVYRKKVVILQ